MEEVRKYQLLIKVGNKYSEVDTYDTYEEALREEKRFIKMGLETTIKPCDVVKN